jgi:agmatinase
MKDGNLRSGQDGNRGYSGVPTFLRSKYCQKIEDLDADYAVLGVPYDEGSPFVGGSRFCARSVREHSLRFPGALYDIESDTEYLREALKNNRIMDLGDIDVVPSRGDKTMEKLTKVVQQIQAKGAMPIILGGDHTITYPIVRAYSKPIHVIQLDAHIDYTAVTEGMTYINSTSFRLLHQLEHVKSLTQVGIRSMRDERQNVQDAKINGSKIVTMPEVRNNGPENVISHLPKGEDCYVTIDIDAYDMSLVPGCVSGEPGGFTFEELKVSVRSIAERMNVVGFDFVEVNPPLDVGTGSTSYLGALTVSMFLGYIDKQTRLKENK